MPLPMTVTGIVVDGDKVGRTIGFPTANLDVTLTETELEPGIYVATCQVSQDPATYYGLAYFGPRLIFGEIKNKFEVWLYDFDRHIYGQQLTATLTHHVRPPSPFTTLAALQTQLEQDKQVGLGIIANLTKQST